MQKCILCDIDRTLFLSDGTINAPVHDILKNSKHDVIFVTCRPESELEKTLDDLLVLISLGAKLLMRADNDYRPHWQVKKDMLAEVRKTYEVMFAIDDQTSIIKMYHKMGVNCLKVVFR
jgi:hydroxymethylpyrimidine pyrophosphatase-like HAD family hydrolase